jgi:Tfp pilus tip-associated adhesin PilY1
MRRGGRGIVALDITQPDPLSGNNPTSGAAGDPGCLNFNGSTPAGCIDEYPKLLWEFSDTADSDGNLNGDLGWTWSTPAIARIAIYNATTPAEPKEVFVAFFGGGWDFDLGTTGNFIYAVDIETGQVLVKYNTGRPCRRRPP